MFNDHREDNVEDAGAAAQLNDAQLDGLLAELAQAERAAATPRPGLQSRMLAAVEAERAQSAASLRWFTGAMQWRFSALALAALAIVAIGWGVWMHHDPAKPDSTTASGNPPAHSVAIPQQSHSQVAMTPRRQVTPSLKGETRNIVVSQVRQPRASRQESKLATSSLPIAMPVNERPAVFFASAAAPPSEAVATATFPTPAPLNERERALARLLAHAQPTQIAGLARPANEMQLTLPPSPDDLRPEDEKPITLPIKFTK